MSKPEEPQAGRAASRIVDFLPWLWIENPCHQDCHFTWRVELARALPLTFGKLANQVLVGAAQDVRLNILQAQAAAREKLDQRPQLVVAQDALACRRFVEVLNVYDPAKSRVLAGDGANRIREVLTQAGGVLLECAPARFGGNVEPDKAVVLFDKLGRLSKVGQFVTKNMGEAFEED